MKEEIRTAESVMCGHPDKFCDLISDMVVDACLVEDSEAKVACEAFAAKGLIVIGGEITSKTIPDYEGLIKGAAARAGCDVSDCERHICVNSQSADISQAVKYSLERREGASDFFSAQGAGDQGVMVGYATDETLSFMPLEYEYARLLTQRMEFLQRSGRIKGIKTDGKVQVSALFRGGKFNRFTKIVISVQHSLQKDTAKLREEIMSGAIQYVFGDFDLSATEILINPSGRFVTGGIEADTGLTGRKIVADAYGPRIPVGGGAFSGKDPSKVDRSAAYMARYVAKNVVAARLASECKVTLAYAIGKAEPLAVSIDTFGTGNDWALGKALKNAFDFRPRGIIAQLDLLRPIYAETASGGHFGRKGFSWERTDKTEILKQAVSVI